MKLLINNDYARIFEDTTGITCIPLPPYERLDLPISSHADMLFCILDNTVFCYKDYIEENGFDSLLQKEGYFLKFVSKKCEKTYPNDIALNVLKMGNLLFCNQKYVATEVVDYANINGYKIINIKQGYSACSTLIIDENNAITSDIKIQKAMEKENKNVLLASNDKIVLNGYNCGFFGGASGVIGKKIYFFGDISTLPDYENIKSFIYNCGFEICSLSSGRVCDFGGFKQIWDLFYL